MSATATARPDLFARKFELSKVFTNICSSQMRFTSIKRHPKLLQNKMGASCQCMNSKHWRNNLCPCLSLIQKLDLAGLPSWFSVWLWQACLLICSNQTSRASEPSTARRMTAKTRFSLRHLSLIAGDLAPNHSFVKTNPHPNLSRPGNAFCQKTKENLYHSCGTTSLGILCNTRWKQKAGQRLSAFELWHALAKGNTAKLASRAIKCLQQRQRAQTCSRENSNFPKIPKFSNTPAPQNTGYIGVQTIVVEVTLGLFQLHCTASTQI